MRSTLVLIAALGFIFWLLRYDSKLRKLPSKGIWIAILWLAILSSRPVSQWLTAFGFNVQASVHGNSTDSTVYLVLIVLSIILLIQRGFEWGRFFSKNKVLILIFLFLACSAMWAEHPVPTLKRTFKNFGCVLVALVLLTESRPIDAIRMVFVRLSYFITPLSIVFIKYFPDLGRMDNRSGSSLFSGVTTHKNTLGVVMFVYCLFIIADIMALRKSHPDGQVRLHIWIRYGLLALGVWLLLKCDSVTALICLVLGVGLFFTAGVLSRIGNAPKIIFLATGAFLFLYAVEVNFQVSSKMMIAVGRDPGMTGRSEIWEMVKASELKPVLGYGYLSYWESEAAQPISDQFLGTLKTVHNGFREMYLDGGMVGLALLILLMFVWGTRAINRSSEGSIMGRLSFVFWALAIVYNFSETSFFRLEPLWCTLLLTMIELPRSRRSTGDMTFIPEQRLSNRANSSKASTRSSAT